MSQRLFLIDGSSQMYRAYHAMRGSGLTGPGGRSTHAVYIFVTMLRKLIQDHQPQYIAASFDLAGPTFRSDMATDYKANRAPMPPDLAEQIPWVHEACEALGVPILTYERFEADDVIGTLATQAAAAGFEVAIVTGDKDFFQLVHDGIKVYNPRDDGTWYDADGVKEKFGVAPEQVVDVLALMGDSIDNIKGVPGIGEKGARDLIAHLRHRSTRCSRTPRRSRTSAIAKACWPTPKTRARAASWRGSGPTCRSSSMPRRCAIAARRASAASSCSRGSASARWSWSTRRTRRRSARTTRVVRTLEELRAAGRGAAGGGRDSASACCRMRPSAMRAASPAWRFRPRPRHARYVPLTDRSDRGRRPVRTRAPTATAQRARRGRRARGIEAVLEDAAIAKVGHDLKFDAIVLERHGVALRGIETDTMLASYLLDATRSAHPLEELALEHAGYKALREEDVCGRGAKAIPFAQMPADAALDYAGERADLALQLSGTLRDLLREEDLETCLPRPRAAADSGAGRHRAGGHPDRRPGARRRSRTHVDRDWRPRSAQIFELAGEEFNINSPKQLSEILFDKLQLPALKRNAKTKTASTAVEVLEELALAHDLPRLILEWRALQKLKGTYIDALPQLVNPDTGRVHTCFNQAVAATGRLSSSDPNLQNIPIRTELGREIRRAFIAERGHVLISADYSQIELRVLAHLSGDEALIEAFRGGEDIHDRTALKVFGTDSGLSEHELRRRAKIINYALLYGKTAFTLAKDIGVTQQAAQEFIDAYFAGFPSVRAVHRRSARNRARQPAW